MINATPNTPYATFLNVLCATGELIDTPTLIANNRHRWFNQTLCRVNDAVVRLGIIEGEYHWHRHCDDDEFFYVVSGHLRIDLRDRTIELAPGQAVVIGKGIEHRPVASEKTVILMVENAGIVPTGN
jgi:mannose-6-phosphate isomerase-like protein (cupin superfamily)